jgi:hypothetical protein
LASDLFDEGNTYDDIKQDEIKILDTSTNGGKKDPCDKLFKNIRRGWSNAVGFIMAVATFGKFLD